MTEFHASCSRCVGRCFYCGGKTIKHGFTKGNKQRYKCRLCHKTRVCSYQYQAYQKYINPCIISLTKEGLGIRSTSRILKISPTTLLKRIICIAEAIPLPPLKFAKSYEVDELRFFIGRKSQPRWLAYAIERETKQTACFYIGKRDNNTLNAVIKTLKNAVPAAIFTDKLKNYKTLIPKHLHKTSRYQTNHIERKNLTLRTHLKRFQRKGISFSRSTKVTTPVLRIYFWAKKN